MVDSLQVSMRVASSGLQAQSHRVRIVSENLANHDSTGNTAGAAPYTRKTITFGAAFDRELGAAMVRIKRIDYDKTPFPIEHDPSHPAADAGGFVKHPNVNMLTELADIREANRSYEANLQVVKQARSMIGMTIDLMRSGS
jgi:flagellar basal-body rod protein FlgC